jgi:transcriptional regulator with GAF, ATPase, and Fis domain
MSDADREQNLTRAFVDLADTLVTDYDVADLLQQLVDHCVDLLGAIAAGLLLSDQRGHLQVLASSSEQTRLVELFQLQADEGPCLDCYRTGQPVEADLADPDTHWPRFSQAARAAGYTHVQAVPLRLREQTIGAMNLFTPTVSLPTADVAVAQALADVATIGILSERSIRHHEVLTEQLQYALNSRVVIEQAKGIIAEARQVEMDQAFAILRSAARSSNRGLTDLARALATQALDPADILTSAKAGQTQP